MYEILIANYIEKISKEDVINFAQKKGITLNNSETDIIYMYVKNHWRTFYNGNPNDILAELKNKLETNTYHKLESLYKEYKNKIN